LFIITGEKKFQGGNEDAY